MDSGEIQSNLEIAGSLEIALGLACSNIINGGRALNVEWRHLAVLTIIKLRIPLILSMQSERG